MDNNQTPIGGSKKFTGTRPSQKTTQKKKSESKKRLSTIGTSPQNPKPAKQRKVEDIAKTSPLPTARKIKDLAADISQDSSKPESKKQSRKKNKGNLFQSSTENKEIPHEQVDTSHSVVIEEEGQKTVSLTSSSKLGSELSKSKKRRIRKRRLLESLGIVLSPVVTVVTEKASKKKKKKKKKKAKASSANENNPEQTTNVKSSKKQNINLSNSSKKITNAPEEKRKDVFLGKTEGSSGKLKEVVHETHTKAKPLIFENKAFKESQLKPKQKDIKSEDNTVVKICSNCDELQLIRQELDNKDTSPLSESRSPVEEVPLDFLDKKEENSPPLKTELVNFLSHNNVEGLFRSALLNDVTLSSRCSEKEVKNFFNTYGTFSERGRTQFAAVEKLLSNNKSNEDLSQSQFFDSSSDKGISSAQNLTPVVTENKDLFDSKPSSSLLETNKYEYFSVKHLKDTLNSEEPQSSVPVENFENDVSSNIVKDSCRRDSLGSCLVLTGGFTHGPIYTSPNFQNRVTNSANSNQISGSGSRVFLPNVYGFNETKSSYKTSCRVSEQEKPEPYFTEVQNSYSHDNNFPEVNNLSESVSISTGTIKPDFPTNHQKVDIIRDSSKCKQGTEETVTGTSSETLICNAHADKVEKNRQSSDTAASNINVSEVIIVPADSLSSVPLTVAVEKVSKVTGKAKQNCEKGAERTEKHIERVGKGEGTKEFVNCFEVDEKDIADTGEKVEKCAKKNREFVPKVVETPQKDKESVVKAVKESEQEIYNSKKLVEGNEKHTIVEVPKDCGKDRKIVEKDNIKKLRKFVEKDIGISEKDVDGAEKDIKAVEKCVDSKNDSESAEIERIVVKQLTNAVETVKSLKKETDITGSNLECTVKEVKSPAETIEKCMKADIIDKSITISEKVAINVEIANAVVIDEKTEESTEKPEERIVKETEIITKVVEKKSESTEEDSANAGEHLESVNNVEENSLTDQQKHNIESVAITEKYIESFRKVLEDTEKELEALDIQSCEKITRNTREEVECLQQVLQGNKNDGNYIANSAEASEKGLELTSLNAEIVKKQVKISETNKESIDKLLENIEKDIVSAEKKNSAQKIVTDKDSNAEILVDSFEKDHNSTADNLSEHKCVIGKTVCAASTNEHLEIGSTLISEETVTMNAAQGKDGKIKLEKSREDVLREREAKKAAKIAKKGKVTDVSKPASSNMKSANDVEQSLKLKDKAKDIGTPKVKADKVSNRNVEKEVAKDKSVEKENEMFASKGNVVENIPDMANVQPRPQEKETGGDANAAVVAAAGAGKSKTELKAERRAKQEAQRAAKAAAQQSNKQVKLSISTAEPQKSVPKEIKKEAEDPLRKISKAVVPTAKQKVLEHRVKLFNHLYPGKIPSNITEDLMLNSPEQHPAIAKLGIQYSSRIIVGSNARCIALLNALKQLIQDYETPPEKEFSRGLEGRLKSCVMFLEKCRPLSVSMTNALRHLKWQLTQLPNNVSDSEAKKKLQDAIDTYIRDQIEVAAQAICIMVQHKIADGDVILVYSCSSLVQRILLEAHNSGTKFRVVVVDGRPWREGREMLRRLVSSGLKCTYVLVSAASFIMREVTKVLLGAHALLANGYVMSRAGASQIALVAHAYNVPVLVCCETHKFCERVQTDSFVYNELGDPDDLVSIDSCSQELPLSKWRSIGTLTPLNLTYDVTPPDLVTAVVTELAILPCTSVPVILRIKPTETGC